MFTLARLLLIAATLSLGSSAAIAKDIPGLPKELLGTFARSLEDCRDYFQSLKSEAPADYLATVFREKDGVYTYGDCDVVCFASILSYTPVKTGYVLKMRWIGRGNRIGTLSVTKLDGDKLRLRFLPDNNPWDVMSCSKVEHSDIRP